MITRQDLFPEGVELTVITAIEAAMCDDVMDVFVDSTNLTNNENAHLFPVPTWEVIHPNFAQVFGLKVAEKMGKKAFLMDISRLCPTHPVATLVRLEGSKVLALSPGTLEARRGILQAFSSKPKEVVKEESTKVTKHRRTKKSKVEEK